MLDYYPLGKLPQGVNVQAPEEDDTEEERESD
jgi:hypothetical protein